MYHKYPHNLKMMNQEATQTKHGGTRLGCITP